MYNVNDMIMCAFITLLCALVVFAIALEYEEKKRKRDEARKAEEEAVVYDGYGIKYNVISSGVTGVRVSRFGEYVTMNWDKFFATFPAHASEYEAHRQAHGKINENKLNT